MSTPNTNRPLNHLSQLARDYPGLWKTIDQFRGERGRSLPRWADWCFLPMAAGYAIVSGGWDNRVPFDRVGDIARISALASWRVSQGIYRFDETIMDALWDTPGAGKLPVELFFRMPEWCVYIETESKSFFDSPLHGFFAHLEDDANEPGHYELRLLLDCDDGLQAIPLHLEYGSTIESGLDATIREGQNNILRGLVPEGVPNIGAYPAEFSGVVAPLISLILYLCSEEPDLQGPRGSTPSRPTPRKTKQGRRLFPPDRVTTWDVGSRIGETLRRAYETESEPLGGTHASPRPHIRRAHWHSFWTGPRSDESKRRLILKWLYPMVVGLGNEDRTPH